MAEVQIFISENYVGLGVQIASLPNAKNLTTEAKENILTLIISAVDTLAAAIRYRRVKSKINIEGATRFIDIPMGSITLESFFGENELEEMERQIKDLTWRISETSKAINFNWQLLF